VSDREHFEPIRGEDVVEIARSAGFPLVGITPATPIDDADRDRLASWLAAGKQGEMGYLAEHFGARVDPRSVMPGARSMILVADQYWRRNPNDTFPPDPPAEDYLRARRGRIARYARGDDYHKRLKKRLFGFADLLAERYADRLAAGPYGAPHEASDAGGAHAGVKVFVDTAPIMERLHAARSGLGWIAKNSLLIHQRRGSYLFLGGILTTLDITPPKNQRPVPDRCGTCSRCIDACPTDAITPYSVDATRCISYLTIEHRGEIDPAFHEPMGEWVFGCDICQEVCPHNSARTGRAGIVAARPEYAPHVSPEEHRTGAGDGFDLLDMLGWTEDDRARATRGSAIKRAKLDMLRRNAVIAAANAAVASEGGAEHAGTHADELARRVRAIAEDEAEPPVVRAAAAAAARRLGREG
jgi:epoxyqueuosine reductase